MHDRGFAAEPGRTECAEGARRRRKDRLFVRVTYTNLSPETVTVDRDAVTLQLSNGRVVPRSLGTTTTPARARSTSRRRRSPCAEAFLGD